MAKKTSNPAKLKKPHVILWLGIIVLLIPCIALGAVLLNSLEDSTKPVVVDRFNNELNPAITENDLSSIKGALNYENVDKLEVNLISATLRVMINTADNMQEGDLLWILNDAAEKVTAILPVETYFTNKDGMKMYDLEIHVYNTTKGSEETPQIYYTKTKNAASEEWVVDNFSTAKNGELAQNILYPPITDDDVTNVYNALSGYENVDGVSVSANDNTLLVNIDTADTMAEGDILWLLDDASSKVLSIMPMETYFSQGEGAKGCNLEIRIYNVAEGSEETPQIYYIKTKLAATDDWTVENPSSGM